MSRPVNSPYVLELTSKTLPYTVGSKARNLQQLYRHGYSVPKTYICTWNAYLASLRQDSQALAQVKHELAALLDENTSYAVRSSANVEDSLDYSFAGQFESHLNVSGLKQVLQAVQAVWQSARSPATQAYLRKIDPAQAKQLKMAVMIQEMVHPIYAGVAFSKNPITAFDEVVVESIKGSGVSLVQHGYSPQRWIYKWGGWVEQPATPEMQMEVVQAIVDQTKACRNV